MPWPGETIIFILHIITVVLQIIKVLFAKIMFFLVLSFFAFEICTANQTLLVVKVYFTDKKLKLVNLYVKYC